MKRILKLSGICITIIITVLYVSAALSPFISPLRLPITTLLGIAYIPSLFFFLVTTVVWFFINRKIAFLLVLFFLVSWKAFFSTVGFNALADSWNNNKQPEHLRVLCWNVNRFGNPYVVADTAGSRRRQMMQFITETNPDIICFQDFAYNVSFEPNRHFVDNPATVSSLLAGAAYVYAPHYEYNGSNYADIIGPIIFSRLPAVDSGRFATGHGENVAWMDILYQSRKLRVYAAHFSSMSLWPNTREEAGIKYLEGDSTRYKTRSIVSKLQDFGQLYAKEAETIKRQLQQSPHPVLFSGDLNSVPSSYIYHHLKKGLQDAFLETDFGIGGTYNRVFPKLRIDVLLHSPAIEVVQYTRPVIDLSDHYPIVADIKWKE